MRLTPLARSVGLVHDYQWTSFLKKQEARDVCMRALHETCHSPHEWRALGVRKGYTFNGFSVFNLSQLGVQVPCSLDGTRRSAASMVAAQYVSLQTLMSTMQGLKRVLQVTRD